MKLVLFQQFLENILLFCQLIERLIIALSAERRVACATFYIPKRRLGDRIKIFTNFAYDWPHEISYFDGHAVMTELMISSFSVSFQLFLKILRSLLQSRPYGYVFCDRA